jgi:putative endonuclease
VSDPRRLLGSRGEDFAAAHLERRGFRVIARNQRTRLGEIDLVAYDGHTLVFAEVKTRRVGGRPPFDSLGVGKRLQVRRLAAAWLAGASQRPRAGELRFDALGVVIDARGMLVSIEHLEGAF